MPGLAFKFFLTVHIQRNDHTILDLFPVRHLHHQRFVMVRHRQEFSRIVHAVLNQPLDNQVLEIQHSTLWKQHSGAFTRGP
ncbi:hypothetical protein O165_029025 [Pseudomonas soli]|nr:hypothetical protein O165_029025 [Pseudomonas soli]